MSQSLGGHAPTTGPVLKMNFVFYSVRPESSNTETINSSAEQEASIQSELFMSTSVKQAPVFLNLRLHPCFIHTWTAKRRGLEGEGVSGVLLHVHHESTKTTGFTSTTPSTQPLSSPLIEHLLSHHVAWLAPAFYIVSNIYTVPARTLGLCRSSEIRERGFI